MRHDYPLTDETRRVLTGNCPKVADGMHVSPSYIYGILEGTNPDPFAYFIAAFEGACARGVDVTEWKARQAEIEARYRPDKPLPDVLCDKMQGDTKTNTLLVDALKNGRIDEHERRPILRAVAVERDTLDYIEAVVTETAQDVRDFAAGAVKRRKNA